MQGIMNESKEEEKGRYMLAEQDGRLWNIESGNNSPSVCFDGDTSALSPRKKGRAK